MATKPATRTPKTAAPARAASSVTKPTAKAPTARKTKPTSARKPLASKPAAKPLAKSVAMAKVSPGKVGKKPTKLRPVLVRDSFTMPESDFALIAKLKITALSARRAAKKSELLRAGLQVLAALDAESLVVLLDRLETVKTGRPKKGH
jgi:hypothetical protein